MANKRTTGLMRLFFVKPPDDQIYRAYGVRVVLFFVLVVIVAVALFLIYQFTQTLYQLHIAEGERDHWQRPDDVIDSLKLKDGDTVADVGCGVGYFSLKLAPKVAGHGSVLAEDILDGSLTFLWIRAFLHHQSNIRVIHGDLDDPHLPKGGVDAVLIANSYHEFTKPLAILVKHYVNSIQRRLYRFSVAHVALHEFCSVPGSCSQPRRLTIVVGLRFEVVENAD